MSERGAFWPERRQVIPIVLLLAVGAVGSFLLAPPSEPCPEEYWPHKINSIDRPAVPCDQVLREIVDLAVAAHKDPLQAAAIADIELSIKLALQCAYQDDLAHNVTQKINHRKAVDDAYKYALAKNWKDCAIALTVDPVNHPH